MVCEASMQRTCNCELELTLQGRRQARCGAAGTQVSDRVSCPDYSASSCWLVPMCGARSQRVCLRLKVFRVVGLLLWLVLFCSLIRTTRSGTFHVPRKKERLCLLIPAGCIKERSHVLKGRTPPHRPRGRASTDGAPWINEGNGSTLKASV
eukprot:1153865-Pelagomonas_calceolata.AAC.1